MNDSDGDEELAWQVPRVVLGSACIHEPPDPSPPDSDHQRVSVTVTVE
ncbi:hypothetical protein [Amycolatopsis magusensis]